MMPAPNNLRKSNFSVPPQREIDKNKIIKINNKKRNTKFKKKNPSEYLEIHLESTHQEQHTQDGPCHHEQSIKENSSLEKGSTELPAAEEQGTSEGEDTLSGQKEQPSNSKGISRSNRGQEPPERLPRLLEEMEDNEIKDELRSNQDFHEAMWFEDNERSHGLINDTERPIEERTPKKKKVGGADRVRRRIMRVP